MQLPQGYALKFTQNSNACYVVELLCHGVMIGNIRLVNVRTNFGSNAVNVLETHSNLDPKFRNCGLGVAMYAGAIKFGLQQGSAVVSSYAPSTLAKRVWTSQRLAQEFVIMKLAKRWWVFKEK